MKWRRPIFVFALILVAVAAVCVWREARLEKKFTPQIQAAASRYGVDPLLVKAVVWRESRFNPGVHGGKGEIGLMQIQERAAQEWANAEHIQFFQHEHCFAPVTNTLAGAYYLGKLLKRYAQTDNPAVYALADYNAGRSNVMKWNLGPAATNSVAFVAQIGFPNTRHYVRSVLRRRALYEFLSRWGWD